MAASIILDAMRTTLALARRGPAHGPNPRVGCVIIADGAVIGEGWHRGAGTPHAEVAALADAEARGKSVEGATAVVSLEPCNHYGRTGPCAVALREAGIAAVRYALPDPGQVSGGGAQYLREHGIAARLWTDDWPWAGDTFATANDLTAEAAELVHVWYHAMTQGRPWVTLKMATTLDGRIAAVDGTSQWITGPEARAHAHAIRAEVDAIAVTTGTALADDPALTARDASGALSEHQPARVVVGHRDIPGDARLQGAGGPLLEYRTHDVAEVLADLHAREVRHLLVEGGAALHTALLSAGVVDEIHSYVAATVLGEGREAISPFGVTTLADAPRFTVHETRQVGADVFIASRARKD